LPVVAERGDQNSGAGGCTVQVAALKVRAIQRAYGARQALAGVDLDLHSGEIYGLLGPNGAGKTSLVRAISGRLRLDAGSVRLNGEDPMQSAAARRCLGLVPQDVALYPDLTCRENLEVFGQLMGLSRSDARSAAKGLLNLVGLSDRAGDRVATLSGGMKRRLNVAAGVIHHPKVLLLDEPTVGVDPSAREDIHELLVELRREGLAILLTTHDLEQASELSDRVGVLIDGQLRVEGRVADLVHEVFGGRKELLVALADAPEGAGLVELETAGLEPSRDQRLWTGLLERGLDDLSAFAAELERAGLEVEEVRVREPSLRGVFFQLAGREIDE
jgi:ABC-2 type transport system ATP-binding protein